MQAQPLGVGSRFRRSLAILRLAFSAAPVLSVLALKDLLCGKVLRGWSGLYRAAASNLKYYSAWIQITEPLAVADWHSRHSLAAEPDQLRIGLVPLSPEAMKPSGLEELLAAMPARAVLIPHGSVGEVLDACRYLGCDWLLPFALGSRFPPHAASVLQTAAAKAKADVIYWDHDTLAGLTRENPVLKPAWDPLLQSSIDVLFGAAMIRCDALDRHSDALRDAPIKEIAPSVAMLGEVAPAHIPLVLVHLPGACAVQPRRRPFPIQTCAFPGVSILIPTRDRADLLQTCFHGLAKTAYPGQIEVILIDNDSRVPETFMLFDQLSSSGLATVIRHAGEFNFSAMINRGIEEASHDVLCFLNNDVEPIDSDWLTWMVEQATKPDCGAVGARLLYPDRSIQHAGIVIGIGGAAGHLAKGTADGSCLHWLWHSASRRVSAVTAACMVLERTKIEAVGGMDQETFAVDFNDVDLCLRLEQVGFKNCVIAEATLIHAESKSRGASKSGLALKRFDRELAALRARWGTADYRDPWSHPLFRIESQECLLKI